MNFIGKYISTQTTTVITEKSTGTLHSVVVGETSVGAITVSDKTGTLAVLKASIAEGTYLFDINYHGHLTIVTAANSKICVAYS